MLSDVVPAVPSRPRALMSWSSGKDSAWALHVVRERGDLDVVGLLATFNGEFDRVSMHGVRRDLVEVQARRVGLPLWWVELPWPCPNLDYQQRMAAAMERARAAGIERVVFGDLFLEDVRAYRTERLAGSGVEPDFPLWCGSAGTRSLAQEMVDGGVRATIVAVDPRRLDASFAGRTFDADFLADLPPDVDPLGENGEFHTFCYAGPMFDSPIHCAPGDVVERDGFVYADLLAG